MGRSTPLKLACKQLAKEVVWLLSRHAPGAQKDICLFSSRRGGSTWFMEVIASNRGVRYIDQPFSLYRFSPGHLGRLPVRHHSQFASLPGRTEEQFSAFVRDLLAGTVQVNAPWEVWHPTFHWRTHRVVLKILAAKPLIDWFDRTFDVHIVYSTRHPIPTALSVMRNGWGLTVRSYLQDEQFASNHLNDRQLDYAWDLLRAGTPLQQHMLNWAVENLVPLRLLPKRPQWLYASYEEALLAPEETLERLETTLHLPDRDRMFRQIGTASRSTRKLVSATRAQDDARGALASWRKHVTEEDERVAFEVLDRFGIDLYRFGHDLPVERTVPAEADEVQGAVSSEAITPSQRS
jgi:hypothetical protein